MGNRAWSLKLDFESPPTRYASALDANSARRHAAAAAMRRDFESVLKLERAALIDIDARHLRKAIFFLDNPPCRLMYLIFERGGFNPLYPKFQRMMQNQLKIIPDSRIVEVSFLLMCPTPSIDPRSGSTGKTQRRPTQTDQC